MSAVVIDCDPGVDDAIALLWAFAAGDVLDLRAVTVVAGNVPMARTETNARRVATLAGRTDVPIHAGCPRPLVLPLTTAEHVHGTSGLAGADLPEPAIDLAAGHAVDRLIALARSHDTLTICALGPLTNLAVALVKAPDIADHVDRIVLMGGAIGHGNVTPAAEFNIYVDPHAARVVFESGIPIVMCGLDVTEKVRPTPERIQALAGIGNAAGNTIAGLLGHYAAHATDGGALHDPVAVGYLMAPELFDGRDCHVEIATDGLCRGRTVVDWKRRGTAPANVLVLDHVDDDALFERLRTAVATLP